MQCFTSSAVVNYVTGHQHIASKPSFNRLPDAEYDLSDKYETVQRQTMLSRNLHSSWFVLNFNVWVIFGSLSAGPVLATLVSSILRTVSFQNGLAVGLHFNTVQQFSYVFNRVN